MDLTSKTRFSLASTAFKSEWKNLLTGAFSGIISKTFVSPIERLKILRQLDIIDYHRKNVVKSLHWMYSSEGIIGFFKGNGINVIRYGPYVSLQFYFYEVFKNIFIKSKNPSHSNSYFDKFICGSLAAIITISCTYPLDFLRTFFSIQTSMHYNSNVFTTSKSIFGGFNNILKAEGIRGLYKGWFMTILGSAPYTAVKFSCFDCLASHFMPNKNVGKFDLANLFLGSISGIIAATLFYTADIIRRKMQLSGLDISVPRFRGTFDCLKYMYKNKGILSFYKGLNAQLLTTVPSTAIMFTINERMKKMLKMI